MLVREAASALGSDGMVVAACPRAVLRRRWRRFWQAAVAARRWAWRASTRGSAGPIDVLAVFQFINSRDGHVSTSENPVMVR